MSSRISFLLLASAVLLSAVDADHDFSGKWIIAQGARLSVPFEDTLTIEQTGTEIRCSSGAAHWSYALNGTERKAQFGGETRNSLVKWEGAALLINTIVSGPSDYVVMDRWRLSADHATLTVTRQIIRGVKQEEGFMKYRRDSFTATTPPPPATPEISRPAPAPAPLPAVATGRPTLARRPDPPAPNEIVIPAGTHIPLAFRNTVDTRHSHEGDNIYLETAFPVARDGQVVIPRGSFVNGVITQVKQAGRVGKGEISIRFDTLALPNGVKRDFRSHPAGGDEGQITTDGDRNGASARQTAQAAGTGATIGGVTGAAAGHGPMGLGIGGAAGGIASVLFSHAANGALPQGTTVDMVLDRDLHFSPGDLR